MKFSKRDKQDNKSIILQKKDLAQLNKPSSHMFYRQTISPKILINKKRTAQSDV